MTQEKGKKKKKKREGDASVREQGAAVQVDKGRDISEQRRTWKAKQVIKLKKRMGIRAGVSSNYQLIILG